MWGERSGAPQVPLLSLSVIGIAALLGACPVLGAPQAAKAGSRAPVKLPPLEALQLRRTTAFPAPAPVAYRSGIQCDSEGDAFVQPALFAGAPLRIEASSSVAELIPDEKRVVTYGTQQLTEQRYPHATVMSFAVLPDGKLYELIFTRRISSKGKPLAEPEYYVERFQEDGTVDSITRIDTPPGVAHWYANLLAPFPDGSFLIAGTSTATKERPGAGAWQPFTAVYDSTGRFVSEVILPEDITNRWEEGSAGKPGTTGKAKAGPSPARGPGPQQYFDVAIETGGVVSGPDGNVWVLRNSDPLRLYAVDTSGQVVQHFEFSSPASGVMPFDFGFVSPEEIYVDFAGLPGGSGAPSSVPSELIGVFNTTLRQFESLYTVSQQANMGLGSLACSDGHGGFLYLSKTHDDHIALFDYSPR